MKLPLAGLALVLTVVGLLWAQPPGLDRTESIISDPSSDAVGDSNPIADVERSEHKFAVEVFRNDPPNKRLNDELMFHERQSMELAHQLRLLKSQKADERKLSEITTKLQETVVAAFSARRKLQDLEVQGLRERLAQIEKKLAHRDQARDQIVARRIQQLTGETSDEWDDRIAGESIAITERNVTVYGVAPGRYQSENDGQLGRLATQDQLDVELATQDRLDMKDRTDDFASPDLVETITQERLLGRLDSADGPHVTPEHRIPLPANSDRLVFDRSETIAGQGGRVTGPEEYPSLLSRRMPTDFLVEQQKISEKIAAFEDESRKTNDLEVRKLYQARIEKLSRAIEVIRLEYRDQNRRLAVDENASISRLQHAEEELQRVESLRNQGVLSIQEVRQHQLEVERLRNRVEAIKGMRNLFEEAEARVFGL